MLGVALALVFRAHLAATGFKVTDADLERALRRLVDAAEASWSHLGIAPEAFVAYMAERFEPDGADLAALERMHAADLALAFACVQGNRIALDAFEQQHVRRLDAHLRSGSALASFSDEVKQTVRVKLLVGDGDLAPKIASYRGEG